MPSSKVGDCVLFILFLFYLFIYFEAGPHCVTLSRSILELSMQARPFLNSEIYLPGSAPECWDQRLMALCLVRIVSHQNPSSSSVVAPDLPQTVATQLALHEFAESYCWIEYYRKSYLNVTTLMLIPEREGSFSDSFQSGAGCPPSFYMDIFIFKNYYCCCCCWYIVHMCVGSTCI